MNKEKQKKLENKGWKVTTVAEFLELTPAEESIIEIKLALSKALKEYRQKANLTQTEAAKKLKTSQSRLAKMEAGDRTVSLDLLIMSLFSLGIDKKKLAEIIN